MGLFGGSKSSSSTQNITEVDNVGASDGSIAANENSVVNVLDAGAIEDAFGFGGEALNRAFDLTSLYARESLGVVERSASTAQKSFENALASTLTAFDAEQSGGAQRVLMLAGLALAALVYLMRAR